MTADTSWLESMPEVYDRCLGLAVFAPFGAELALRAADLKPSRVLEIAAGTGIVTAGLVEALPDAEITATDLNPPMVDYASTRVPGPTWRVADAQALDLDDDVFDLVVCQFGVMFFPNRIGAYREVRRVLEPHGSFLFNVWDTLDTSELPAAVYAALAEVLPDNPPDFGARIPRVRRPDADQGRRPGGGLTVEELERIELVGKSPSAAQLAEGFSARRCGSSCRSAATSPRSSRRSRR